MSKTTATHQILAALKRGERITGLSALAQWKVYRLSSIIHNLRSAGNDIQTKMVTNGGTRHAEYFIV